MPTVKKGEIREEAWPVATSAEDLPGEGPVFVTQDLWQEHRAALLKRAGALGLRLASDQSPESLGRDVHRFDVIALEFPKFTDGRAYSNARILRERLGYEGELRAVGHVLRDQFLFMARCGFDAIEPAKPEDGRHWRDLVARFPVAYQPAGDGRPVAWAQRRTRGG